VLLALYKIRALLDGDLRLRTACDLQVAGAGDAISADSPAGFTLPSLLDLEADLPEVVEACRDKMAGVTTVRYSA